MRGLALLVALLSLSGTPPPGAKEMKVTKPRASVMEKPQFWGRTIGEVAREQKVLVTDRSRFPWFKVQLKDRAGYVHSSAFDEARVSFAGAADAAEAPATSQRSLGLAARGLTREIEQDYRRGHPNLEAAFAVIERYEELDAANPSDEEMRQFTAEGALLGAPVSGAAAQGGAR